MLLTACCGRWGFSHHLSLFLSFHLLNVFLNDTLLDWYSLFLTVDCISFLCICFIVSNCLIYLLTSFFKVLSVFPKLARRIIKLSKYSTVFHVIKHIKKPHQFTPYSSLLPSISLSSVPIPLLPLLCPLPSPSSLSPFLTSHRTMQGVPFTFLLWESVLPWSWCLCFPLLFTPLF